MSLLNRYGIKEVADVTFYELDESRPGMPGKPVLYLDTLKVSSTEQTAENTDARGGKGNSALLSWDYGKEIILNLEDALFSGKSLEVMYGSKPFNQVEKVRKIRTYNITNPDNRDLFYIDNDVAGVRTYRFNFLRASEFGIPYKYEIFNEIKEFSVSTSCERDNSNPTGEGITIKPKTFVWSPELPAGYTIERVVSCSTTIPGFLATCLPKPGGEGYNIRITGTTTGMVPIDGDSISVTVNIKAEITKPEEHSLYLTENGKTFEGPGYLIYNSEYIPLCSVFSEDILKKAGLLSSSKIRGEHLIAFETKENLSKREIDISANSFPGTYYVTADTFVRDEKTGKDKMFQLILPKVKIVSESNTITMEAEGDPTVFNMQIKALKSKAAPMMRLVEYEARILEEFSAWVALDRSDSAETPTLDAKGFLWRRMNVSDAIGPVVAVYKKDNPSTAGESSSITVGAQEIGAGPDYVFDKIYFKNTSNTATITSKSGANPQPGGEGESYAFVFADNSSINIPFLSKVEGISNDEYFIAAQGYLDGTDEKIKLIFAVSRNYKLTIDLGINWDWMNSPEGRAWLEDLAIELGIKIALTPITSKNKIIKILLTIVKKTVIGPVVEQLVKEGYNTAKNLLSKIF